MASKLFPFLVRSLGRPSLRQTTTSLRVCRAAAYSTEAPPPPLLSKLKEDLKAAMRAKDANRLAVLRGVLAETLNRSKTDKPIKTDVQLVLLLKKSARKSQDAAAEARAAGREDLAEKEEAQQRILEEYAANSGLREVGEAELRKLAEDAKASLVAQGVKEKALMGKMIEALLGSGGSLSNTMVEHKQVVAVIQEVCKAQ